ncbi:MULTISPECIES: hypothetical protein [unclassified Butyrivibrio]|uniref:hypothetical protein n=1 Tax=unclassified Butyrivibrio TaxID=2639466 RepID=UPI0003B6914C|nr:MULTISPECIES: hypothetical protein [unclassified Butyrivibrio]
MSVSLIFEIIGYVGSALVLLSFMMVSVYKLRIVNMMGSLVCVIYGLLIHAYPTVVMNLALVAINIYYLTKMRSTDKNYDLVRVSGDEGLTKYMIDLYKEDIAKCFPGISMDFKDVNCGFVVCHKGTPAGILLGNLKDHILDIKLDYSIPEYRDFSIGEFLMSNLIHEGIDKLVYNGSDEHHKAYLRKTGFVEKKGHYERTL